MNILDDSTAYTDFMIRHRLTTNQFYLLYLLYTERMIKDKESGKLGYDKFSNIYKWLNASNTIKGAGWIKSEIQDLIDKEYVIALSQETTENGKLKENYSIDQLILTNKFSDLIFINGNFAFEEILELYPDTFLIKEQTVFTKTGDLDKLSDAYSKAIKNSIHKHKEMLELIDFAKSHNLCNMKLENFLGKGVIDSIKKMMEGVASHGGDI